MALASSYVRYFDEPTDIGSGEPLLDGARRGTARMRALRFYVHRFDRWSHNLSGSSLEQFIEENREDALAQGLTWKPAPSTLRRAIQMAEVQSGITLAPKTTALTLAIAVFNAFGDTPTSTLRIGPRPGARFLLNDCQLQRRCVGSLNSPDQQSA